MKTTGSRSGTLGVKWQPAEGSDGMPLPLAPDCFDPRNLFTVSS